MSKVEKVEHYISVSDTTELSLITDIQFGERFTSNALNRHWKNIKPVGIYCGFEPSIVDVDRIQVGDGSDKNTLVAQNQSGELQLTVHQQKPITVTVPRDQKMTAVVEAFYQFGVLTKQVDTNSNIDAATLKLIPSSHVESHHVQLFSVFLPSSAERLTDKHIDTSVRSYGTFSREAMESTFVKKTNDGGAMEVPSSSDDSNPVEGLERWNPVKKRVEYSKAGKWNGMGGGGSTLKDVEVDTLLEAGDGCIVNTIKAQKQVIITLSGDGNATGGDEHIVGDIKDGSAFKFPIKVVAEGDTKVDGEDEFLIDIDGARVTFNYNEEKDNWELSSGFGERPTPKAVFHPFESKAKKGDTTFNFPYSIGFVTYSLNGVEQSKDDFTATDGKTIVLTKPIKRDGDVVQFKAWLLVDQISDVTYTRKGQDGTVLRGATSISLPAGFLQNDVAKSYYFEIGGVRQWPDKHYTVSSATNEILLKEPLDNDYDWYLLSEAQVQLFVGQDSQIDADNTNNSLTGKTVKENIDQLDEKVEAIPDVLGNQNLFINGCFSEWQRGLNQAHFTQTRYTSDRWQWLFPDSTADMSCARYDSDADVLEKTGCKYFMSTTAHSASGLYVSLTQKLEGIKEYAGKTLTLSFWAKASKAMTVPLCVRQEYSTKSINQKVADFEFSTEWKKNVVTFKVPDWTGEAEHANACTWILFESFPISTWQLDTAAMKLEYGDKATPFIPDLPSVNKSKCQRYYEKFQAVAGYLLPSALGWDTKGKYWMIPIEYKVPKRNAAPSISLISQENSSTGAYFGYFSWMHSSGVAVVIRSSNSFYYQGWFEVDAEL